jgi:hypothetical protein
VSINLAMDVPGSARMFQRGTQIALRGAMERQRGAVAGPTFASGMTPLSLACVPQYGAL